MENEEIISFPIKHFSEYRDEDSGKSIVVLSGTRTKLYRTVELLIEAHNKKDFAFEETDTVYFAALPQAGNEHVFADVSNKITRIDPVVHKPSSDDKKLFGTTEFDIRNIISLLKPKYIMPVSAYFKQLDATRSIAKNLGFDGKNVIVADNGEIFEINKGVSNGVIEKFKAIEPKVVESVGDDSINNDLIEERKSLGKDGIVSISFIYNEKEKLINSDIDIQMKGVVISKGQEEVMDKIRDMIFTAVDEHVLTNQKITKAIPPLRKAINRVFRENYKKVPTLQFNFMEV